jgi:hypothetical protein
MTPTDTPRTDAIEFRHCPPQPKELLKKHQDAYALSRELERELAASQAEVEKIKEENRKFRELCERAIDDAVDALEERDLKRRIADEIESRRKELMELTKSTN